jgi:hypothetical protein
MSISIIGRKRFGHLINSVKYFIDSANLNNQKIAIIGFNGE